MTGEKAGMTGEKAGIMGANRSGGGNQARHKSPPTRPIAQYAKLPSANHQRKREAAHG